MSQELEHIDSGDGDRSFATTVTNVFRSNATVRNVLGRRPASNEAVAPET